jgi:hypothetical protein
MVFEFKLAVYASLLLGLNAIPLSISNIHSLYQRLIFVSKDSARATIG